MEADEFIELFSETPPNIIKAKQKSKYLKN